jgi:hypothetical protein
MIPKDISREQLLVFKDQLEQNPLFIALLEFMEAKVQAMKHTFFQVSMDGAGQKERYYRIKHFEELLTIIRTKLENTGQDNKK